MEAQTRHRSTRIVTVAALSALVQFGAAGAAYAAGPVIHYVGTTSALNSMSTKMAVAQCPAGTAVLGGAAKINGAEGQVAIQAAFPTYDAGLLRYVYIVKAQEDLTGTADSWSVTAAAYCTPLTVPILVEQQSAFDSNPIKAATVACPAGMKVVGMGGEVSNSAYSEPAALVGNIPTTALVFQGFKADDDMTEVTARATEVAGALGGGFAAPWKVTAVAACSWQFYFGGLELMSNSELGGGLLPFETESKLYIGCSAKAKRIVAAASTMNDHDMGQWYLHRLSRYNAFQNIVYGEAYRNPELGTVLMNQTAQVICID